ncbi:MAG: putative sugar O-methyltransferase [Terracoccus sp.]
MTPPTAPDWTTLTERSLAELREVGELYRPTSFWGPGLEALLADLRVRGLETFKSWPTAAWWFYPRYGAGFNNALIEQALASVADRLPRPEAKTWVRSALAATHEARRDFDAVRLAWDQQRWPCDLEGLGESRVGSPFQYYRFTGAEHGWTRPYLNYALCMAALSHHVDAPPRRFLEIGGGFGALGEFLLTRDPEAVYVDVDIPPLLTVASWYLRELFGDRVGVYGDDVAASGPIPVSGSAVLPNYRLPDLEAEFDVFVNSYSFQEMEPDVVENYVDLVVARGVTWVVSLNSRRGKQLKSDAEEVGVLDPVTSARIIEMFERRGFDLLAAYDSPLIYSAGQLAVLRRRS